MQALHLATHAGPVTATDLSERALRFAATTAALNGQDWELLARRPGRPGGRSAVRPGGQQPAVRGRPGHDHARRTATPGRAGDAIGAELAAAAPGLLTEGGTMQYLANWVHVAGEDWDERVAGWFAGTGLDAWVIQREVADPMAYVDLWLTDVGEAADPQPDGRLAGLVRRAQGRGDRLRHRHRCAAAGTTTRWSGWRTCASGCSRRWATRSPPGSTARTGSGHATPRRCSPPATGPPTGLQLRQEATMGDEGWGWTGRSSRMPHGLRWTEEIDPLVLALVGGADGRLPLRDQLALLAAAHDVEPGELAEAAGPIVAHLVERGF